MLDASEFNLNSADNEDELVVDKDESAEKVGNWIAAEEVMLDLGKETCLVGSISLIIVLLNLLYSELSIKLHISGWYSSSFCWSYYHSSLDAKQGAWKLQLI